MTHKIYIHLSTCVATRSIHILYSKHTHTLRCTDATDGSGGKRARSCARTILVRNDIQTKKNTKKNKRTWYLQDTVIILTKQKENK